MGSVKLIETCPYCSESLDKYFHQKYLTCKECGIFFKPGYPYWQEMRFNFRINSDLSPNLELLDDWKDCKQLPCERESNQNSSSSKSNNTGYMLILFGFIGNHLISFLIF
jgi:hypothetical protein